MSLIWIIIAIVLFVYAFMGIKPVGDLLFERYGFWGAILQMTIFAVSMLLLMIVSVIIT